MLCPLGLVVAQVPREGLLPPRALAGVADGRKGAHALVLAGVLEEEGEGAVAAHGVAGDGDALGVQLLEVGEEELRQLRGEVRLHAVVGVPGVLGCVDVEGRRAAKVVCVVLAGEVGAARGRVWVEEGEVERRGVSVEEALLGDIVRRARQAGEVDEEGGRFG